MDTKPSHNIHGVLSDKTGHLSEECCQFGTKNTKIQKNLARERLLELMNTHE